MRRRLIALAALSAAAAAGFFIRSRTDPPARLLTRAVRALRHREPSRLSPYTLTVTEIHYVRPAPFEMDVVTWAHDGRARIDQEWAGVHQSFGLTRSGSWSSSDGVVVSLSQDAARSDHALAFWPDILAAAARRPSAFARSVGWRWLPDGTRAEGVRLTVPGEAAIVVDFDGRHSLPIAVECRDPGYARGIPTHRVERLTDYRPGPVGLSPRTIDGFDNGELMVVEHVIRTETRRRAPAGTFSRPKTARGEGSADVPLEMIAGLPFVRASINGSRPLRFMIDTGAGFSALTALAARAAGIRPAGFVGTTSWLSTRRAPLGRATTIRVGNATVRNVVVGLGVPGDENGYGVDYGGLLGFNFIARFQPTLDYPGEELFLRPIGTPLPAGDPVPLLVNGGWTYVNASLSGKPCLFQLDTGTRRTFVHESDISEALLSRPRPAGYTLGQVGKKLDEYQYIAPSLRLGRAAAANFPVYTIAGAPGRPRILGSDFLAPYRVTLDYQRQQAILQ